MSHFETTSLKSTNIFFDKFKIIAIQVVIFGFFFCLNSWMPISYDDILRANINALYNHQIINNIVHDYYHWTGRISAQFLVYFFFNKNIPQLITTVNILNALAFNVFISALFKIATKDKKSFLSKEFLVFVILLLLYFYSDELIRNYLWKTVGLQYFWGMTLISLAVYKIFIKNNLGICFAVFTGIVIGLYNEEFVSVCFILLVSLVCYQKYNKLEINRNVLIMIVCLVVAGIICVFAPGNFERSATQHRFYYLYALSTFIGVLPFALLSFVSTQVCKSFTLVQKKIIHTIIILLLISSLFWFVFSISSRTTLIYTFIFFIPISVFITSQGFIEKFTNIKMFLLVTVLVMWISIMMYTMFALHEKYQNRVKIIVENQDKSICVPLIRPYIKKVVLYQDFNSTTNLTNYYKDYAKFYNLKSVTICKKR
ncbi:DUF6056 family protein [Francisella sp. 19X1-34]|uniref:DUF6056 family protein n=1 Tax=Francisella sp. 19X1-34 TaxID=3087177 RepID=UPI002E344BDF|nr:DUF6056 family protein [Francisella sp. 19X1-34]MED7789395.1 DUF6056 family protein [Francisella sp. 19X1-34]